MYINRIKNSKYFKNTLYNILFPQGDTWIFERMKHQHESFKYFYQTLYFYGDDYDLALSLGECSAEFKIVKNNQIKSNDENVSYYTVSICLHDDYDFEEWDESKDKNWVTKILNNGLGYYPQQAGIVTPYTWIIKFDISYIHFCYC